uniref:Uncharacterized protein n=1 Tax=Aegilops tauschii subsp. strangulata TaxID=200361 RepID=A0A452Y8G3_AEGTS
FTVMFFPFLIFLCVFFPFSFGWPREKKAERRVREEEVLHSSSGGGAEAIPVVHVDSEILFRSSLIALPFLFIPRLPQLFFLVSLFPV